ncbi:MAG: TolC family protein, partial [Candidatus Korobacteraceae bacterium]
MKRSYSVLLLAFAILGLVGCTVGPNYSRPSVDVPGSYRGVAPDASDKGYQQPEQQPAPQPAAQSLGDEKWWNVFQDPTLQGLIRTALKNNYDVRIAATRVLQAQAQLGITHADQLPSLSAGGNITSIQNPAIGPIPSYEVTQGALTATAGWNPDFWGKYRRATESARATLLANEWAQKAVISSLVGSVAADYFTLRQLDLQLEITKRTYADREQSLRLTQQLEQAGINNLLDVRQSEQLVYTAATEIPDLERQIAQEENAISILLGHNPGDIPRGLKLTEEPHAPDVPAGLPSALLE